MDVIHKLLWYTFGICFWVFGVYPSSFFGLDQKSQTQRCFVFVSSWRGNVLVLVSVGIGSTSLPGITDIFDGRLEWSSTLGLASIWGLTRFISSSQPISKYSGTSLKRTSSKPDTSLRRTKILVADEFLRNSHNKTSPKWSLYSRHLFKADTFSRSRTTISPRIYLYKADKEIFWPENQKFTILQFLLFLFV